MVSFGSISASVKLVTPRKGVINNIKGTLLREVRNRIVSIGTNMSLYSGVKGALRNALISQKEYQSLVNVFGDEKGKSLYTLFGLSNPEKMVGAIIDKWLDNVKVSYNIITWGETRTKRIWANIIITAIQADFKDVLSLSEASFMSEGRHAGQVDWLEWLLLRGNEVVVSDFKAVYDEGRTERFSRTGEAIMVKSRRGFRVPKEYSGTIKNNWATRAVSDAIEGGVNSEIARAIIYSVGGYLRD